MIHIRLFVIWIFLFASSLSFGQQTKYDDMLSKFISAVKEKDSESISKRIIYPFRRKYPLPDIQNAGEFIDRYTEIFDDSLQRIIVESDLHLDWTEVGWRGIMLRNGLLWLDTDGRLIRVNYESKEEHIKRINLIGLEKVRLNESIQDFIEPIFVWETRKFRIRVDKTGTNQYRYASWTIGKDQKTKPDTILTQGALVYTGTPNLMLINGEIIYTGSGGNHYFLFKNGEYEYECQVIVLGSKDSPPGFLIVSKNGKEIMKERVIGNTRN
jgi:Fe-S cluster assembly iron-binding protein IscA